MVESGQSESTGPGRGGLWACIEALRPTHWLKNVFVLAPLLFAHEFTTLDSWLRALIAFAAFCMLSSAVYLINDISDRHSDRLHPDKSRRPIASGRLSVAMASVMAVLLVVLAFALVILGPVKICYAAKSAGCLMLVIWTGCYLLLNLFYSFWLKKFVIVDVIAIAMGFVLRAMAGAAAIDVRISPWLVVCTFTLCLYIAFAKRRAEVARLSCSVAPEDRQARTCYVSGELDRMLTVSSGLAIITYSLYCLAPQTIQNLGSANMVWTIPLVLYGIFRFDVVSRKMQQGDVVRVFIADRVLWLVAVLYVLMAAAVVLYGSHPAIKNLLGSDAAGVTGAGF